MKKILAAALVGVFLLSGCGKMQEIPELQAQDTMYNKMVHLEFPRMAGGTRDGYTTVFSDIGLDGVKEYLTIYAQENETNQIEVVDENKIVVEVPMEDGNRSLMYFTEQPELRESSGKEAETFEHAYLFSGFEAAINSKVKDVKYVILPFHLMEDENLESPLDTVEVGKQYKAAYSMEQFRLFYKRYCENYGIQYEDCVTMQPEMGRLEIQYPLIRSDSERDLTNLDKNLITQTLVMVFRQDGEQLTFTIEIEAAKWGE